MGAQSVELRQSRKRGPNDNANCLLRQYFSTGTDFLRCSRTLLNKAAYHLNNRPVRPWSSKPGGAVWRRCCVDRLSSQLICQSSLGRGLVAPLRGERSRSSHAMELSRIL